MPRGQAGVTGAQPAEPTLADVQDRYPGWCCGQDISGMYYADRLATGQQVTGEDPLDLRDQIKAAQACHAWRTAW
jgi:hypothetical protein